MHLSLGGFGQSLSEPEVGAALAALGTLGVAASTLDHEDPQLGNTLSGILSERAPLSLVLPERLPTQHAAKLAELWVKAAHGKGVRLQICQAGGLPEGLLAHLLLQAAAIAGVSVLLEDAIVGVSWHWPMGIGFLADADSTHLKEAIAGADYTETFHLVDASDSGLDYEILMLPWDLAKSAAAILGRRQRLRADLVLVLGDSGFETAQDARLARVIAAEVQCAGLAVAPVPDQNRRLWFSALLRHLAHNLPLDAALATAAREVSVEPPLLYATRTLLEHAQLDRYVSRLQEHAQRTMQHLTHAKPPGGPKSGERDNAPSASELREVIAECSYARESNGAVPISRVSRRMFNPRVGLPKMAKAGGAERAPHRQDTRRVQTKLLRGQQQTRVLKPETDHILLVRIAEFAADWESAPSAIPTERLPPSADGWDLTLILAERPPSGAALRPPQVGRLHLPPTDPSEPCSFTIRSRDASTDYQARLVVLHKNRTLQTWLLRIPVGLAEPTLAEGMGLSEELGLVPGFGDLHDRTPFDAALVLNHDDSGDPTALLARDDSGALIKPEGMDATVAQLSSLLLRITGLPETEALAPGEDPKALTPKESTEALRNLACHGRALFDSFHVQGLHGLDERIERLQVIEARPGSFVPVELFYDHEPPWQETAEMCGQAKLALSEGCPANACAHNNDNTICPTAFWGMSRVIEHQTRSLTPGREFQISKGAVGHDRLDLLRGALLGASEKVKAENRGKALAVLQKATGNHSQFVETWDEWEEAIAKTDVPLLVLLSHTDKQHSPVVGMAGLEIGGKVRPLVGIAKKIIHRNEGRPPAVLLLGCKTKLADIAHQDFVRAFRENGAALVIATLSAVHEKHMVELLVNLVQRLQSAAASRTATFGHVLRDTRRAMLLAGDPFAMTLVAYGDIDWQL